MRKAIISLLALAMVAVLFPIQALADPGASFSISGPSTLVKGQTGTYTIKVTLNDAAAAQANLSFDSSFFELVSGSTKYEDDYKSNQNTTVELGTVTLRCIADEGSSGSISLTGKKASRLTGDPVNPTGNVSCSGGSKTVTNPVPTPTPVYTPTPVQTTKPKPTATKDPSATPVISETPAPTQLAWPEVENNITNAAPGSTVTVGIQSDPLIPVTLLELLKNKKSTLVLDFGDYTCTIDGNDINTIPTDMAFIDLFMDMEKDESLSQAAGGNDVYQFHFNYHGELPGKLTFKVKAKDSKPGDTVYLYYYYDTAGVMEGLQSAVVDNDGYVTFELYHCSDYVVTNKVIEGAKSNFVSNDTAAQNKQTQSAKTTGIPLYIFFLCIAGAALCSSVLTWFFCKKKTVEN